MRTFEAGCGASSGPTGRVSRPAAVVVAAVLTVLLGCGDGGPDAVTESTPATSSSSVSAPGATTGDGDPTSTGSSGTTPDDAVPVDPALADRLPDVEGLVGEAIDPPGRFDDRFCDGSKAPAHPQGQVARRYRDSGGGTLLVAVYRFADPDAAQGYAAEYAESVRRCTEGPDPRTETVDGAELFVADTDDAYGEMLVTAVDDEVWVGYAQHPEVKVEMSPDVVDILLDAAAG